MKTPAGESVTTAREARWSPAALAVPAVLALLSVGALVAVVGRSASPPLLAAVSAVCALGCAVVLALAARPGAPRVHATTPARLWAAAFLLWGAGEAWTATALLVGPVVADPLFPGDPLCVAAAVPALAGSLRLPRAGGDAGRVRHVVLDAVLVTAAAVALVWTGWFDHHLTTLGGDAVSTLLVVTADVAVLAVALRAAVASLDLGTALASAGLGLFAAVDLATTLGLLGGGGFPWQTTAAVLVAWPAVTAGCLLARPGRQGHEADLRVEVRAAAVMTVVVVALTAAVLVLSQARGSRLDPVAAATLGVVVGLFAVRELAHRRQRARLLADRTRQAHQDPLTGLANRRALVEDLEGATAGSGARSAPPLGVVLLDLDGFGDLNVRSGQHAGDVLLRRAAASVAGALPDGWTAHRLGGDEFVLVGPGGTSAGELAASAAQAALGGVLTPLGTCLTACCGVAETRCGAADPLDVLSEASAALVSARAEGRGRTAVHTAEVAERARRRTQVAERLRVALVEGGLDTALQPVVDIATGRTGAFEALSRWDDPVLGRVGPAEFVEVAEAEGLVVELGRAVVRRALAVLVCSGAAARGLRLSVNASGIELRSPGYATFVRQALLEHGVAPAQLTIEVTESTLLAPDDPSVAVLAELAADGVRVALDDFGTGYSSLSYLERLPVHVVKIDRSMVVTLGSPRSRGVVEAVLGVCRALDLDVIAEGVEEPEQAEVLHALGVRWGQGWLWSPAIDARAVAERVERETSGRPVS